MDAGTGEVYIKDTDEIVSGSAGHALNLKITNQNASNLKLVLVERDNECFKRLKNVIGERWSNVPTQESEGPIDSNSSNIYLINAKLEDAINNLDEIYLGNALFFFDPLRSVEYSAIEKVAGKRIGTFYETRTEFFIFVFTSDWFLGRDEFTALPTTSEGESWSDDQLKTVLQADALFGYEEWREHILTNEPIETREQRLIDLYRLRLHRWFRYVLPLPFIPKKTQLFHLILCSNYEAGVQATKYSFYSSITNNPRYSPKNALAFDRFKRQYQEISRANERKKKPPEFRVLWSIIKEHEKGYCDCECKDLTEITGNAEKTQTILEWLKNEKFVEQVNFNNAWDSIKKQSLLDWAVVKEKLGIEKPLDIKPLSPDDKI